MDGRVPDTLTDMRWTRHEWEKKIENDGPASNNDDASERVFFVCENAILWNGNLGLKMWVSPV